MADKAPDKLILQSADRRFQVQLVEEAGPHELNLKPKLFVNEGGDLRS